MNTAQEQLEPISDGETPYRLHRRFDRMGRLCGDAGMERLFGAHVMVVGLGGVGSFTVEALARSGIGRLTLVDFDRVCVTNTNRQLQAVQGVIGRGKAVLLADRVRLINPQAKAEPIAKFYSEKTADEILSRRPDFLIDAIDNVTAKCHLLAACRERGIPVVSSLGASGRWDPTRIRIVDMADTTHDPLADAVRRILRRKHAFPLTGSFGISAVYSEEPPKDPIELHYDGADGFRCVCPSAPADAPRLTAEGKAATRTNDVHSCEERRLIYGTASFVTGSFGLAAASVVVRALSS